MPALNKIKFTVPAALAKYVGKNVPREAKMMAAKGMVPIPPKDLVVVLFYLAHDPDEVVKTAAEASLVNMPPPILKSIVEASDTHPLILDFFARHLPQESGLLEAIALNKVTHDETIVHLAGIAQKNLVDIISNNQTRILRHPKILDVLGVNPICGQAIIDRMLHFIALQTGTKTKAAPPPQPEAPPPQQEQPASDEQPPQEQQQSPPTDYPPAEGEGPIDYTQDGEYPWMDQEEIPDHWAMGDLPDEFMMDSDGELSEEEAANMTQRLIKMGISEKIKMAFVGNKEARSILIKDSNKLVAGAVLSSPKITDKEIEDISRSRSVSEDIIRQIAANNEWSRSYVVKSNLVSNPKTPIQTAIRFLNFLTPRDLAATSKSKNVPSPVATAAKKLLQKRQQKD